MPRFWPRLLKTVLPVALFSGAVGCLYALAAGAYVADERDDGSGVREALLWRVPFAMAAWAGGFTLLFEVFRHWWAPKTPPAPAASKPSVTDSEQLLLQLLEQAEAAEKSRASQVIPVPTVGTNTPAPAGSPAPSGTTSVQQRA